MQGGGSFYTGVLGHIDALGSLGLLQLAQQFLGQQIAEGAE